MTAEYPESFLKWVAKRTPNVRRRILRLNSTINEGARIRGYHPHARWSNWITGHIGKREFIAKFGREAWAMLPRYCIVQKGHRKSVTREAVFDNLWKIPADHPIRRARREKGYWVMPP